MKSLIATFVLLFAVNAFSDQCVVIDQAQADAFMNFVKVGDYVGSLCEPCDEQLTELGGPIFERVQSLEVAPFDEQGNVVVKINGKDTDLAYTYINTTKNEWYSVNAALLVGCDTQGVTPTFKF